MTNHDASEVMRMADFAYAWRITDERWTTLPDGLLARIYPLSRRLGEHLVERSSILRHSGPRHVNAKCYHVVDGCSLKKCDLSDGERIHQWLSELPIAREEKLYVSWGGNAVVATDWGTFIEVWDDLWYPFDVLDVFEDSLDWAVLLGPEEFSVFIKRGAANTNSNTFQQDAGCDLARVSPPEGQNLCSQPTEIKRK